MDDSNSIAEDKKSDSKYKRYVAALDKCLQSFESVSEWADVISFLSRLGKVFQSFPSFDTIPFKLNLAKRLAQCLNPALPAGVHQKTLEVYEMVFRKIGNEGLAKDLSVYSFGLFPFFEHATTLVKNSLLELYEVYLIPLGKDLRPPLRALVLSVILGLEEESSEFFVKVNNLLNRIKVAVGQTDFYEAIWTGLLMSPHHRLAIINYLLKNIPPNLSSQELLAICVNNTKLTSSALASALKDPEQLVIRGALDILLKFFPIEKRFFEARELANLLQSSLLVLMRKDMSLTRRFYNWILVISHSGTTEIESFPEYTQNVLIDALKTLIEFDGKSVDEIAKPFKLLVFLLDKPIVSNPLIRECLFDLIGVLVTASKAITEDSFQKLLATSNLFFRMLELDLIWGTICLKIRTMDDTSEVICSQIIDTISFSLMNLSVCEDTPLMVQLHIAVSVLLNSLFHGAGGPTILINKKIGLCLLLLNRLSPNNLEAQSGIDLENDFAISGQLATALISGDDSGLSKIKETDVISVLRSNLHLILKNSVFFLKFESSDSSETFKNGSEMVLSLMSQFSWNHSALMEIQFNYWLETIFSQIIDLSGNLLIINALLDHLLKTFCYWEHKTTKLAKDTLTQQLIPKLWSRFVEESPDQRNELTVLIMKIGRLFPTELDIVFAKVLSTAVRQRLFIEIEAFTYFWEKSSNQSVGGLSFRLSTLILADNMSKPEFKFKKCSNLWLYSLSRHLDRFLVPAFGSIMDVVECGLVDSVDVNLKGQFKKTFDKSTVIYYLNVLNRLLQVKNEDMVNYLLSAEVENELLSQWTAYNEIISQHLKINLNVSSRRNYFNLVLCICVPLLSLEEVKLKKKTDHVSAKTAALDLLGVMLMSANAEAIPLVSSLINISIEKLSYYISSSTYNTSQQARLLRFLRVLFSNPLIAPLFNLKDMLCLADLGRKALKMSVDAENMEIWTDFVIVLALLPSSEVDIIITVLNDSLVGRLHNFANQSILGDSLSTSSLFSCSSKLAIYYLVAKINAASGNVKGQKTLRNSVSGLLNDTISDAALNSSNDARILGSIKSECMEKLLLGYLEAHQCLVEFQKFDPSSSSNWDLCIASLSQACHSLYSTNQALFTQSLITLFTKYCSNDKKFEFSFFFEMFHQQASVEFIRNVWIYFKSAKDSSLKNQEILLNFINIYCKHEPEDSVNMELWSMLIHLIKDSASSGYKQKFLLAGFLDNCCSLLVKLNRVDGSRISKDMELVSKFTETCIIFASKLNDPNQWTSKPDEIVEINSDKFTSLLNSSVKESSIGKCMNSLCRRLIPNLTACFLDLEKVSTIMTSVIANIVTVNFRSSLRASLMGQISIYFLQESFALNVNSFKPWRRDLWESFFDNSFLWMPSFFFSGISEAFRLIAVDPDRYSDILNRITSSTTTSMFLSKDADVLNRALNLRRLSFLTFWGNLDSFRIHLPSLQEKLVELTKYYNGFILGEIFFLVRIMLLRTTNDEFLSSLWPLIMTELVQLFEGLGKSDVIGAADLNAIFQACKLIDLMLTLRSSSILMYHWLFFDPINPESGLFHILRDRIDGRDAMQSSLVNQSPFHQACLRRRPILEVQSVKDISELRVFLEVAKAHLSSDYIIIQTIDMEFIDKMIERDLLEPLEIK